MPTKTKENDPRAERLQKAFTAFAELTDELNQAKEKADQTHDPEDLIPFRDLNPEDEFWAFAVELILKEQIESMEVLAPIAMQYGETKASKMLVKTIAYKMRGCYEIGSFPIEDLKYKDDFLAELEAGHGFSEAFDEEFTEAEQEPVNASFSPGAGRGEDVIL